MEIENEVSDEKRMEIIKYLTSDEYFHEESPLFGAVNIIELQTIFNQYYSNLENTILGYQKEVDSNIPGSGEKLTGVMHHLLGAVDIVREFVIYSKMTIPERREYLMLKNII